MKILWSGFCALLSIAIYVVPAEAQVNNVCPTGTPGTTIFYGNGVSVTGGDQVYQEASNSLRTLQDALESAVIGTSIESESRYYCIAWNPSGGLLLDVFQSIEQRILGDWSQFWRYLGNLDLAPDWFQSLAVNIASGIDRLSFVNDSDLQTQVAMYRAQLAAGRKIAVVSHSQGNFYANEANNILYNGLDGQPSLRTMSFGVVAVAEPADNVAGKDRPYTTLLTDSVILAVIAITQAAGLPLPLLPNTLDFCIGLCHLFEEPYLKEGTNSRRKILSDVIDVITQLVSPNTSPPEPEVHYLSFRGGNPGIPGDGIVVQADASGNVFTMVPMFSLSGVMNGITVSVFPPNPVPVNTGMFVQLGAIVDGLPVDSCRVAMSLSEGARPVVNGIVGIAAVFTQAFLDSTAEGLGRAIPACADATSDKFRLTSVQLFSQDFNFVSVVDAVAVGIGQNIFPQ